VIRLARRHRPDRKDIIVNQCGGLLAPYAFDLGRYQEPRFEEGEDGDFAVFYYLKELPDQGIRIFGTSIRSTGRITFYQLEFI
jgi:hypothetical protein